MTVKQKKAVEAMRDTLHQHCKDMAPREYEDVLEAVQGDIEANLEALREEAADEDD